ncbi:MAG: VWA domain-containing protein [Fidelibacterota bacterium]
MIDFRHPLLLVLYAVPVLQVLIRWLTRQRREKELRAWGGDRVRKRLFGRVHPAASRWKRRLRWLAMALLVLGAAGPRVGTQLVEVERKGSDILVALDISSSMRAEDVKPSRLEKAKFGISRLISRLKGDRIGIVVFAGTAHLYLPVTGDYQAARLFVEAIDTDMIQPQGTAMAQAIRLARSSFPDSPAKARVLLVVTDGEDHEGQALQAAREVSRAGITVHTVGVGTATGSLIPEFDENGSRVDFKKDRKGKLVTSTLHAESLREIAEEGGGSFIRFDNQSGDVNEVLELIEGAEKRRIKTHRYSQFEDRYQTVASGALALLLTEFFIPTIRKREEVWRGRFV